MAAPAATPHPSPFALDSLPVLAGLAVAAAALLLVLVRLRTPAQTPAPASAAATAASVAVASPGAARGGRGRGNSAAAPAVHLHEVRFFYGSQTGTAEKFAKQLARDCAARVHGTRGVAVDLDSFNPRKGREAGAERAAAKAAACWEQLAGRAGPHVACFVVATYGEGDPPDNGVEFYKRLLADPAVVASASSSVSASASAAASPGAAASAAPPASTPAPLALPGLAFTVFGLGNRQYEHFNASGRKLDARLESLGARRFYTRGEGDDDNALEEDFAAWRDGGLWVALRDAVKVAHGVGALSADAVPAGKGASEGAGATAYSEVAGIPAVATSPGAGGVGEIGYGGGEDVLVRPALAWRLLEVPAPDTRAAALLECTHASEAAIDGADRASRHLFGAVTALVVRNDELRPAPSVGSSTRHVELSLEGTGLSYETADNLLVCPENEPVLVEAVARWQGFDLDQWFTLEPAAPVSGDEVEGGDGDGSGEAEPPRAIFPTPCSVRTCLSRYCDLGGKVDRDLCAQLAPFAASQADRERLRRLGAGKAGRAEFDEWGRTQQRSVAELFQEFGLRAVDLAAFVQLCPRLQPRAYTIASSARAQPRRIAIVASLIDAPKPGPVAGRRLRGVTSAHLQRLAAASAHLAPPPLTLRVLVRPSTFRLPADAATPIVMVGPGTGVAPMMAFLEERRWQRAQLGAGAVGPAVLFFGCRARSDDFIFRAELEAFVADGTLQALHVAFSRAQERKIYVQNLIGAQAAALRELLERRGAHVYVCGATKMGTDVLAAFDEVGGSKDFVKRLQAEGRYVQELWQG